MPPCSLACTVGAAVDAAVGSQRPRPRGALLHDATVAQDLDAVDRTRVGDREAEALAIGFVVELAARETLLDHARPTAW